MRKDIPLFLQLEGAKYLTLESYGPVALSCVFGLAISFFGFSCRQALSATSFTVVGVTNKLLTVLINVTVWAKHASNFGVCMLLVCIGGGVLYQVSKSLIVRSGLLQISGSNKRRWHVDHICGLYATWICRRRMAIAEEAKLLLSATVLFV